MADARPVRVGTRGSPLALVQARAAIEAMAAAASRVGDEVTFEIAVITTSGDARPNAAYTDIGPKGVFAAELQEALRDRRVDVAVHSLKDLTGLHPAGLGLGAVLRREDVRDVVVSRTGAGLDGLSAGAAVGTSAARRAALIRGLRPDLRVVGMRGNVDTRLRKVHEGEVDAAVLAGAGIIRLGRADEVSEWLPADAFVPAPGQGAIAVEVVLDRLEEDLTWVRGAEDHESREAVDAERAFMTAMEGGCQVPLGCWARREDDVLVCDAFVSRADGTSPIRGRAAGPGDPTAIGRALAADVLARGARAIIEGG